MFVLGAVLARWRDGVAARVQALPTPVRVALLLTALLLLGAHWYAGPLRGWPLHLADMAVLVGAGLILCLALGWRQMQAWLLQPPLQWLGRVSYSLYLYHTLILLVIVRVGSPLLPLPVLLALSFLLAFPVAHLAYQWIELPAMKRGQRRATVQASAAPAVSA